MIEIKKVHADSKKNGVYFSIRNQTLQLMFYVCNDTIQVPPVLVSGMDSFIFSGRKIVCST